MSDPGPFGFFIRTSRASRDGPVRGRTDLVPGRLPLEAVKDLAPLFNEHLAAHVILSLQYQKQAWVGPARRTASARRCARVTKQRAY